jgi:hypothetical protein
VCGSATPCAAVRDTIWQCMAVHGSATEYVAVRRSIYMNIHDSVRHTIICHLQEAELLPKLHGLAAAQQLRDVDARPEQLQVLKQLLGHVPRVPEERKKMNTNKQNPSALILMSKNSQKHR